MTTLKAKYKNIFIKVIQVVQNILKKILQSENHYL